MKVCFTAIGKPEPQGSSRAFVVKGRAHITSANPALAEWRRVVSDAARQASELVCERGAVQVAVTFYLPRPKSAPRRVVVPVTRPDVDKLARSTLDAMTGILWRDDSQVTDLSVCKRYCTEGQPAQARIEVEM